MTDWQNRIVGLNKVPVNQLHAHELNARRHPAPQREALRGSLDTLGIVAPPIRNVRTNTILDGHARVEEYLTRDENMEIHVLDVDLAEHEEALFLASFDYITQLATYDRDALDTLLKDVQTDDTRLQAMLSEMAERTGVILADGSAWSDAFGGVPDTDKSPFQQMTFTLHDTQAERVREALKRAKSEGGIEGDNENSNGNALFTICQAYLNG